VYDRRARVKWIVNKYMAGGLDYTDRRTGVHERRTGERDRRTGEHDSRPGVHVTKLEFTIRGLEQMTVAVE
jgi:hypothetical protein